MRKKVFISYDHSEDRHYKELLRAWDMNDSFEFEFDQRSPNEPIDSENASVIKAALTKKLKEADYLLVIIGAKSSTSKWMNWEINRAKENDIKLKLAVVKIDNSFTTPQGLLSTGASFSRSFTLAGIVEALKNADNYY